MDCDWEECRNGVLMYVKIIAYALAAILLFGAGFKVASWRDGNKFNAYVAKQNEQDAQGVVKKLDDVLSKTQTSADETQAQLTKLNELSAANSAAMENISTKSRQMTNEIAKLGAPKCKFDVNYGRVYEQIGTDANSGRSTLYGPEAKNKH